MKNDTTNALRYLEEGFKKGYTYDEMKSDRRFDNIRSTPEFKALMKKYFPNEYKE